MRLGLVGYGKIAPKHIEALRAHGAEFVAAANRSAAGREKAKTEIPRVYESAEELVDREQPDGVVVTASCESIFGIAKALIPTRTPLLLEKPPGLSLAELDELRSLARTHETSVMVGLNRRHYSVIRRALADAAGEITAVWIDWSEDPVELLARGLSTEILRRHIFRNSLHGLDLLAHLAGPVDDPQISARSLGDPLRWIMSLQGISTKGTLASFRSTWDAPGRWRVVMTSRGKTYTFAPLESCTVSERGVKTERAIEPDEADRKFKPGFFDQSRAFLELIKTGRAAGACTLDDARPGMALAQALTDACLS
jgi:predicted dehydrogenase